MFVVSERTQCLDDFFDEVLDSGSGTALRRVALEFCRCIALYCMIRARVAIHSIMRIIIILIIDIGYSPNAIYIRLTLTYHISRFPFAESENIKSRKNK